MKNLNKFAIARRNGELYEPLYTTCEAPDDDDGAYDDQRHIGRAAQRKRRFPASWTATEVTECADMWTEAAIETQTIGARRKKREQHRCGAWRAVAQRRDRQGEPDRRQAYRQRALFGAPSAAGEHGAAAAAGDRSHRLCFMEAGPRPRARTEADMGLCRGPGGRDVEGGAREYRRRRLPMAARRSNERGFRLLRRSDGEGPLLLRRTLPDGLQAAEFAGLGRAALRGHRVYGGCLKPRRFPERCQPARLLSS